VPVPPWFPPPPPAQAAKIVTTSSKHANASGRIHANGRFRPYASPTPNRSSTIPATANQTVRMPPIGREPRHRGKILEFAAVLTATLTDDEAEPLSANEFGATAQVAKAGAPAQRKDTFWLKPRQV
jgi:hypothetical protein